MSIATIDIWSIAAAVIAAVGGGGVLVIALSSWLGRVWAERILESDKAKYEKEFLELKTQLDRRLYVHNVAAARLDAQRVDAIRELYGALVSWHEAVIQIVAPNQLNAQPLIRAIVQYKQWAAVLYSKAEHLEKMAMNTAIYFSEETYQIISRCGISASDMSIAFLASVQNNVMPNTPQHMIEIEAARSELKTRYESDYAPARMAVVTTFRQIIDPKDDG